MLEWKHHAASDNFKAINDIRGVHHTCRLCIHVATKLQAHEDDEARAQLVGRDQTSALKTPIKARVIDNQNMVKKRRLSTRVPLHPCTCRPSDIRPPLGFGFLDRLVGDSEVHRLYVRERGRFRYRPVLMDGTDLSVSALHAAVLRTFQKAQYVPAWVERRKEMGLNWTTWGVYKVHPSGITLRNAMEHGSFTTDSQFREFLRDHPCPKLEVILV
jgi:glycoprotein 3-alpha-L-fucosyltransferase